ncbi:MAG: hypothetical protein F4118_12995 [Acidimicrobiaceae bacterium]|nr:hypothetical protein [Acidimicrobiaceae bacterium]
MRSNECEHGHDECVRGCDERGIALQTIIIVVVLLAIAGAVSAVLLTRAGTETDRLEGETDRWTGITNETGCEIAGGVWNNPGGSGSCGPPGTVVHNASTPHALTAADCHTTNEGDPGHTHTFTPGVDNSTPPDGDFDDPLDIAPMCT